MWPVTVLAAVGVAALLTALALGRTEPVAAALALLGAAYAVILVLDDPALDAGAAVVGAALLAIGELAYLSIEARSATTEEAGAVARRIGSVAVLVIAALFVGGALSALVDLVRTGGIAIEVVGAAAAAGVVGLLVAIARGPRIAPGDDRKPAPDS